VVLNGPGADGAKKILLVEDDDDLRHMFADALRFAGFDVTQAPDGLAALHILENGHPDLIVLDLVLPGIDGLSIRDEILAHTETRRIPIVIVTGSAEAFGRRIRNDCVLHKPVMPDKLVRTVRNCLPAPTL
jgi:DNA-binding response OmpR family regulator